MRAVLAGTGGRLPVALGVVALIALLAVQPWVDAGWVRFVFWPVLGVVTIVTLVAMVRRLHAMGHSGAWVVLAALPIVGIGLLLWMMVGARGGPTRPVTTRHGIGLVLIVLAGLFISSRAVWQIFAVQGDAMAPSVQAGDWLIALRKPEVRRGAVVVFRHPNSGADHFFRVVGLPGDVVEFRNGRLHLNGVEAELTEEPAFVRQKLTSTLQPALRCTNEPVPEGGNCEADRFTETAEGLGPYPVLDLGDSPLDNTPPVTVPDGAVFVLGDNRDNAVDSRFVALDRGPGFVPFEAIHGQAVRVAFNASRDGRIWVPIP